jgi:hypothetical protein
MTIRNGGKLTDEYSMKVDSCVYSVSSLGSSVNDVCASYGGTRFPESTVEKKEAFEQVIAKELSPPVHEYFTTKCSLTYHRDRRQPHEYAVDLVLGWIVEDAVVKAIERAGTLVVLNGHDRYREFLSPRKISTQPDMIIQGKKSNRLLEIFSDWKDTWKKKGHADLRDNKFERLVAEKALLLGIAPISQQGFLIDMAIDDGGFQSAFIPAYQKMGYTTTEIRERLVPLEKAFEALLKSVS